MAASRGSRLHLLPLSHARRKAPVPASSHLQAPSRCSGPGYRAFSVSTSSPSARRPHSFNSGFTSSYDPTDVPDRGPMFANPTFGVPQFYPRDLKSRVDEYVVGQERAKKTICSAIFNHYQNLRRRRHDQDQDNKLREKLQRQNRTRERDRLEPYRDPHPVEGQPFQPGPRRPCVAY